MDDLDNCYELQEQAFHQLVYVSSLVFGEAAKFLLPWKRLFKVTDSEVFDYLIYMKLSYPPKFKLLINILYSIIKVKNLT